MHHLCTIWESSFWQTRVVKRTMQNWIPRQKFNSAQKGNLHVCALRFPSLQILSPHIHRGPHLQDSDLQQHAAIAVPYGVPLPRVLQAQAHSSASPLSTGCPNAVTWARVSKGWPLGFYSHSCSHRWLHDNSHYASSDAFIYHIYTLHRRAGKICHSDSAFCRFAMFSKGSCSPSSKNGYLAVQLSHWFLFWACECKRWQILDW